jgi:hypothetical protein
MGWKQHTHIHSHIVLSQGYRVVSFADKVSQVAKDNYNYLLVTARRSPGFGVSVLLVRGSGGRVRPSRRSCQLNQVGARP